jgi:hypothetical protein
LVFVACFFPFILQVGFVDGVSLSLSLSLSLVFLKGLRGGVGAYGREAKSVGGVILLLLDEGGREEVVRRRGGGGESIFL